MEREARLDGNVAETRICWQNGELAIPLKGIIH
jgi:hypothetical protein